MRRISSLLFLSALFAITASAQTLVTEGFYGGGEDELRTQGSVSSEGIIDIIQSCYAGYTTEGATVDAYGNFSAAGQFGSRPHVGFGIVDPVDVHFVGAEDTGEGTLDLFVVEDSTFHVLTHVVLVLDSLVTIDQCGQTRGFSRSSASLKAPTRATVPRAGSDRRVHR